MLQPAEWLTKATCFEIGKCPYNNTDVKIEARDQLSGLRWWVVIIFNRYVLSKKEKGWVFDPMPSTRTNKFIEDTRFHSIDEAHDAWLEFVKESEKKLNK